MKYRSEFTKTLERQYKPPASVGVLCLHAAISSLVARQINSVRVLLNVRLAEIGKTIPTLRRH